MRRYQDLIAWQLADAFAAEVARLVRASPEAWRDLRYRDQILDAAGSIPANIVEGFLRYSKRDFSRFLDYALGSLGEAEQRLRHGIALGHFTSDACRPALRLARRCLTATVRLKQSQRPAPPRSQE